MSGQTPDLVVVIVSLDIIVCTRRRPCSGPGRTEQAQEQTKQTACRRQVRRQTSRQVRPASRTASQYSVHRHPSPVPDRPCRTPCQPVPSDLVTRPTHRPSSTRSHQTRCPNKPDQLTHQAFADRQARTLTVHQQPSVFVVGRLSGASQPSSSARRRQASSQTSAQSTSAQPLPSGCVAPDRTRQTRPVPDQTRPDHRQTSQTSLLQPSSQAGLPLASQARRQQNRPAPATASQQPANNSN